MYNAALQTGFWILLGWFVARSHPNLLIFDVSWMVCFSLRVCGAILAGCSFLSPLSQKHKFNRQFANLVCGRRLCVPITSPPQAQVVSAFRRVAWPCTQYNRIELFISVSKSVCFTNPFVRKRFFEMLTCHKVVETTRSVETDFVAVRDVVSKMHSRERH